MTSLRLLRAAWLPCLAVFLCLLAAPVLRAQPGTGYIQVSCEPGVQVFLDGAFKGVTSTDQGGLILTGITVGNHQLKVVKEGFQPQEDGVRVEPGKVFEFRVQPFTPKLEISQRGAAAQQQVVQKVGSLLIQSLPVGCRIGIARLGVRDMPKEQDEWLAEKVPTGSYTATFSALGKAMSHTFEITAGRRTHLFVNFLESKVEDKSAGAAAAFAGGTGSSGRNIVIADLGLELVLLSPGTFALGSAAGEDDERPVTIVTLTQPFWLGKTEVTQAQWTAVMGSNPSNFKGEDRPVDLVSWDEAMEFCRKLTARERAGGRLPEGFAYTLPTEAQWEYACRAGTTGDFAGNLGAMGWYKQNSGNQTHPVGQKQANAWGLHDMHGNVWEWCLDWYGGYPGGSVADPTGAASGSDRIYRGGGSRDDAVSCRSAYRSWLGSDYRAVGLGFRLALRSVR